MRDEYGSLLVAALLLKQEPECFRVLVGIQGRFAHPPSYFRTQSS